MAERNDVDDEGQDDLAWVDEGDVLVDALTVEELVDDTFHFPTQVCSHCDGYYGPCFGQHACTTCHLFLFPDNINQPAEANFSEVCISCFIDPERSIHNALHKLMLTVAPFLAA